MGGGQDLDCIIVENSPIAQEKGQTCDISLEVIHLEIKNHDKIPLPREQIWTEKSRIPVTGPWGHPFLGTEFELLAEPAEKDGW